MILEQHYLACLSQASYFLCDEGTRSAAVVDPRRDVELYLERAVAHGARIEHVLLTHFHADFLAGHLELVARTGARLYLGARARAEFSFTPLGEGAEIVLGALVLRVLETPGHTPESISIVVHEPGLDQPARAVLTGDTLFVGDVGRPDLMAAAGSSTTELASELYDSLHQKLLRLPDETIVYPGHGAGSACGKSLSSETSCTIGRQRRTNYALQPMQRADFVELVSHGQPSAPPYFARAAALNKRLRPRLEERIEGALRVLAPPELRDAREAGAQVLDVRHKDVYARSHLLGSRWIGLEGRFASWAGTVLDLERPIVIVAEPEHQREAAIRLMRVGLDALQGTLDLAAMQRGEYGELAETARLDVRELARQRAGERPDPVLDVRTVAEWRAGHVAGSLNIPVEELAGRLGEVPHAERLVLHCKSGYRSLIAASLLESAGHVGLVDVAGGFDAWQAASLPVHA